MPPILPTQKLWGFHSFGRNLVTRYLLIVSMNKGIKEERQGRREARREVWKLRKQARLCKSTEYQNQVLGNIIYVFRLYCLTLLQSNLFFFLEIQQYYIFQLSFMLVSCSHVSNFWPMGCQEKQWHLFQTGRLGSLKCPVPNFPWSFPHLTLMNTTTVEALS